MKTNKPEQKPHGFCVTPDSKCTMNYCDDNGCNDRKRDLAPGYEVKTDLHTNNLKEIVGAFPDFPDAGEMVESQEDIWHDVLRVQEEMSQSKKRLIPELMRYFTITRNK